MAWLRRNSSRQKVSAPSDFPCRSGAAGGCPRRRRRPVHPPLDDDAGDGGIGSEIIQRRRNRPDHRQCQAVQRLRPVEADETRRSPALDDDLVRAVHSNLPILASLINRRSAVVGKDHLGGFSAIMMVGELVLPDVIDGITEASAIRSLASARNRKRGSTTLSGSPPMRQVPTG